MAEKSLKTLVDQLRAEVAQLPASDQSARDRLNALIADLEAQLATPDAQGHDTLIRNVQDSIRHMEVEHPRATGVLNHIMMTLGNMGI
ncbi:MAG TPA: DUF4404 domain-containing protein [Gammaproteobacteria bacterium]|jgi:hypothetical protein|nr:hypothetical protein [Acidiferrobacteraceae bacterium]MDP6550719.1 DUF4404 family protein [Arenicellales bacterium]MDP6790678.1 DUF4404 family protein [Arenicellales bacterium]MDP6918668.1 DUF4404 family protein [Arenicellales bacterium]HCX86768.1 DUF4404 domain-containing protein [Gammaproteobacteria bacterium]|tara:strand:- start:31254 stop:31517 length:264 start_codon:yes stop_codon:yes gene_type:complete